jgi:predicted O-linked N-acetylglucosamine transferase (SPINDLY family)
MRACVMADMARAMELWQRGERLRAEGEIAALLRDSPDDPMALRSLAEIYAGSGRARESIALWRRLSQSSPADAGILRQLAQALLADGSTAEAIGVLHEAIALEPGNARGYNNLGLAQLRSGDTASAVESLRGAVAVDPSYALGFMNLGLAQQKLGQDDSARASFGRAVQLDPHLSQARIHLSELLRATDAASARRERDRALESHAINLMTVRRHDDAIAAWTQLIDSGADIPYLEGTRFHCLLHCCEWLRYEETARRLQAQVLAGRRVDLPFSFFVHSHSSQAQFECARTFIADRHPSAADGPPADPSPGAGRIKVAYLSFDFHEHATAYLIAGLFEHHDRERFEVTALSYGQHDGSRMRARLEHSVEHFVDVSRLSDREVAEWLQRHGIHIAVDLKGLTGGARTGIFARRAAPLQINFLGYPGTMGAEYMDYIIADAHVIPADDQKHYAEKVVYLPECYQPNDSKRPLPARERTRKEYGLPEAGFVFCCFNNLYKITPEIFEAWMGLLREAAGSSLWLLEGTPAAMRSLHAHAARRGIASERIVFAPHIALAQHLARYRHADLFLDTVPCNAHTTASDALWMGVPVLTVTGETFAGRVATSLLHAVGLPQQCTRSIADYAAHAMRLASTPSELSALKGHLEHGRSAFPLFDTARYCRELEAAYQEIWARHARGERPSMLAVGNRP